MEEKEMTNKKPRRRTALKVISLIIFLVAVALLTICGSCFQIARDSSADAISRVLCIAFGLILLIANYFVWEVELT